MELCHSLRQKQRAKFGTPFLMNKCKIWGEKIWGKNDGLKKKHSHLWGFEPLFFDPLINYFFSSAEILAHTEYQPKNLLRRAIRTVILYKRPSISFTSPTISFLPYLILVFVFHKYSVLGNVSLQECSYLSVMIFLAASSLWLDGKNNLKVEGTQSTQIKLAFNQLYFLFYEVSAWLLTHLLYFLFGQKIHIKQV